MGSSSQDLADALLIIFKPNSSVTDSKVSNGFPAKEVSGQAVGFGGGIFFADFLSEVISKGSHRRFSLFKPRVNQTAVQLHCSKCYNFVFLAFESYSIAVSSTTVKSKRL